MHFPDFCFIEKAREEIQQSGNFAPRTLPVFTAERKEGKAFNTAFGAGPDDTFRCLCPGLMAGEPAAAFLFEPAVIAIHDNGDMSRLHG